MTGRARGYGPLVTAPNDPHQPGTPDGMNQQDVERRAELAGYLGKEVWPATAAELRQVASEHNAPGAVLSQLERLPEGRSFATVSEVWHELHGGVEQHRF